MNIPHRQAFSEPTTPVSQPLETQPWSSRTLSFKASPQGGSRLPSALHKAFSSSVDPTSQIKKPRSENLKEILWRRNSNCFAKIFGSCCPGFGLQFPHMSTLFLNPICVRVFPRFWLSSNESMSSTSSQESNIGNLSHIHAVHGVATGHHNPAAVHQLWQTDVHVKSKARDDHPNMVM